MNVNMSPFVRENLSDKVRKSLYEYIDNLDSDAETKLPSENQIAESYGVSRVTVRRALDELEQEGIIMRIHGRGTFVNPQYKQVKINLGVSQEISELISKSGYNITIKLGSYEETKCDMVEASALGIAAGEKIIAIEKAYYADGHLAILCQDYMPKSIFYEDPERADFEKDSSYNVLRKKAGRLAVRDWVQIQNDQVSNLSTVSGLEKEFEKDVLLEILGRVYDQDNKPIVYGKVYYNTDYIKFNLVRNIIAY